MVSTRLSPGFEKATVTTPEMLTWFGVNIFHFRTDPGWDKFDAGYSNRGFMNWRKRDSGQIKGGVS